MGMLWVKKGRPVEKCIVDPWIYVHSFYYLVLKLILFKAPILLDEASVNNLLCSNMTLHMRYSRKNIGSDSVTSYGTWKQKSKYSYNLNRCERMKWYNVSKLLFITRRTLVWLFVYSKMGIFNLKNVSLFLCLGCQPSFSLKSWALRNFTISVLISIPSSALKCTMLTCENITPYGTQEHSNFLLSDVSWASYIRIQIYNLKVMFFVRLGIRRYIKLSH